MIFGFHSGTQPGCPFSSGMLCFLPSVEVSDAINSTYNQFGSLLPLLFIYFKQHCFVFFLMRADISCPSSHLVTTFSLFGSYAAAHVSLGWSYPNLVSCPRKVGKLVYLPICSLEFWDHVGGGEAWLDLKYKLSDVLSRTVRSYLLTGRNIASIRYVSILLVG